MLGEVDDPEVDGKRQPVATDLDQFLFMERGQD
jgi:hypothetical protein